MYANNTRDSKLGVMIDSLYMLDDEGNLKIGEANYLKDWSNVFIRKYIRNRIAPKYSLFNW